jgi:hypothetical protein
LPEAAIDVDRLEDILLLGRPAGASLAETGENGGKSEFM